MAGPKEGMAGPKEGTAGPKEGMAGPNEGMPGPKEGMAGPKEGMAGPKDGLTSEPIRFREIWSGILGQRWAKSEILRKFYTLLRVVSRRFASAHRFPGLWISEAG